MGFFEDDKPVVVSGRDVRASARGLFTHLAIVLIVAFVCLLVTLIILASDPFQSFEANTWFYWTLFFTVDGWIHHVVQHVAKLFAYWGYASAARHALWHFWFQINTSITCWAIWWILRHSNIGDTRLPWPWWVTVGNIAGCAFVASVLARTLKQQLLADAGQLAVVNSYVGDSSAM